MNAVYDMNGKQGPNRVGNDIGFVSSLYNGYNVKVAAILPYKEEKAVNNSLPNSSGSDYWLRAQQYCAALHKDNWKVPNLEELSVMYVNWNISRESINRIFWSSTLVAGAASTNAFSINFENAQGFYGNNYPRQRTFNNGWISCVRK